MKKFISFFMAAALIFSMAVYAFAAEKGTVMDIYADGSDFLKAANSVETDGDVTVILHGGDYRINSLVSFTGSDRNNVTFKAADGEKVRITGDRPVDGWTETEINGVKAFEASADGQRITGLWNGNTELVNARLPESGFFYVKSLNDDDTLWTEETTLWADGTLGQRSFNADLNDISKAPENMKDVTVRIPHKWHDEVTGMSGFDSATGRISMVKYSAMTIFENDRFCLENVKDALDKAGEWCFDSEQDKIYYIPFEGESADSLVLYATGTAEIISIDSCENITFEGICFENTGWEYLDKKYCTINVSTWTKGIDMDMPQGAIDACSAVRVANSKDIHFKNCEFRNIGSTVVKFADNTSFCSVENCLFDNIGGSAVFIGGQNCDASSPERTHDITVKNNIIGNYGQQFYSAPGVIITYCDTADISNNEIHDGYYTGISCGWMWLFGYHLTRNIDIKDNLIYNVGKGMLSDLGGIYMLGIQTGTKITGNVVHDSLCYQGAEGYAGNGIYTDAGASEMIIKNNLVFNCSSSGLNATLARNNIITNNIVAFCGESIVNPGGTLMDYTAMNNYSTNIFLTDNKVPVYTDLESIEKLIDNRNIMWDCTYGDELYFSPRRADSADAMLFSQASKKGYVSTSKAADPMFADAKNYDFTLSESSPALKTDIGFKAWDYTKAGTISGTTIGLDTAGGQTAYNANVSQCTLHSAQPKFITRLRLFFEKLFSKICIFFKKLFGVK